ncbi:MAG: gas vesicle protein GvpG [Acidobacteriota bacterium]
MFIIDDILLTPVKGLVWMADKIKKQAEAEYLDDSKVQENLISIQMDLEAGLISGEEYNEQERKLLERLEAIRKYKEGKR